MFIFWKNIFLANFIPMLYANKSTITAVTNTTKKGTMKTLSIFLTLNIFLILPNICFPSVIIPRIVRVSYWKTKTQYLLYIFPNVGLFAWWKLCLVFQIKSIQLKETDKPEFFEKALYFNNLGPQVYGFLTA